MQDTRTKAKAQAKVISASWLYGIGFAVSLALISVPFWSFL